MANGTMSECHETDGGSYLSIFLLRYTIATPTSKGPKTVFYILKSDYYQRVDSSNQY